MKVYKFQIVIYRNIYIYIGIELDFKDCIFRMFYIDFHLYANRFSTDTNIRLNGLGDLFYVKIKGLRKDKEKIMESNL